MVSVDKILGFKFKCRICKEYTIINEILYPSGDSDFCRCSTCNTEYIITCGLTDILITYERMNSLIIMGDRVIFEWY